MIKLSDLVQTDSTKWYYCSAVDGKQAVMHPVTKFVKQDKKIVLLQIDDTVSLLWTFAYLPHTLCIYTADQVLETSIAGKEE